eukprot:CAMPEP_0118996660 /NCGR_PEP_ID=MMETSP1173-20130426/60461_1 /TAXON_ID=1034831 /ORGANISM="Rhizochromulina marina cf, Strain CCMP1243" /LENGTH=97 /DNA_ID=CAMNT_0006948063 /DNA_START=25 /DNA_END=315 /DNA_ORIENTATION=+
MDMFMGDGGGEDSEQNAFTFTLLSKLKDSIQSYDDSLKSLLETSSSSTAASAAASSSWFGVGGSEKDGDDKPSQENMLEEQRQQFLKEIEDTRAQVW